MAVQDRAKADGAKPRLNHLIKLHQPIKRQVNGGKTIASLYLKGIPWQLIRELTSALRAALPLGAILCMNFIVGAVLELLSHRDLARKLTNILETLGLKAIPIASPLDKFMMRVASGRKDASVISNAISCNRLACKIAARHGSPRVREFYAALEIKAEDLIHNYDRPRNDKKRAQHTSLEKKENFYHHRK